MNERDHELNPHATMARALASLRWPMAIAALVFVLVSAMELSRYSLALDQSKDSAEDQAIRTANVARTKIRARLERVQETNERLNARLRVEELGPRSVEALLESTLEEEDGLFGLGVAFEPGVLGPDSPLNRPGERLYAPYFTKREHTVRGSHIEYDYTRQTCEDYGTGKDKSCQTVWYTRTMAKGAAWHEPHWGSASQARIANYVSPIVRADLAKVAGDRVGVVMTTLSTTEYRNLLDDLDLGRGGYALLVSRLDAFVATPGPLFADPPETVEQWDAFVVASGGEPAELASVLQRVRESDAKHVPSIAHVHDPLSGKERWMLGQSIGLDTGWTLVVAIDPEAIALDEKRASIHLLWSLLHLLNASVCVFLWWRFRPSPTRQQLVWTFVMAAALLCPSYLGASVYQFAHYSGGRRQTQDIAKANTQGAAKEAKEAIATKLESIENANEELRDAIRQHLEAPGLDIHEIEELLCAKVESDSVLFGAGVAFVPGALDSLEGGPPLGDPIEPVVEAEAAPGDGATLPPDSPGRGLYAPYCRDKNGDASLMRIEDRYDYTRRETGCGEYGSTNRDGCETTWYHSTLEQDRPVWQEPHEGKASGVRIANLTAPLHDPRTGEIIGVVFTTLSIYDYQELLYKLDLGDTGYGFLLSNKGAFVAHPRMDYVNDGLTLEDLARQRSERAGGDTGLWKLLERVDEAKTAPNLSTEALELDDEVTGQSAWAYVLPINPESGWTLAVVFMKADLDAEMDKLRPMLRSAVMALMCFCLSLALLCIVWGLHRGTLNLWGMSIAVSSLLLAGTVFLIEDTTIRSGRTAEELTPLLSREAVQASYRGYSEQEATPPAQVPRADEAVFIPTGVLIQSLDFSNANDVDVTGYVWQRYPVALLEDLAEQGSEAGFVLPEAVAFESQLAYERVERDAADNEFIVKGWQFSATLRQTFDYSMYPFDQKNVWVRFWHKDFDRNFILVPDLAAYEVTSQKARLGIEDTMVIPGWGLDASYFGVRDHSYDTDFGIRGYVGRVDFPELYFNARITRDYRNTLITNVIPLVVVAIMLFGLLLSMTVEDRGDKIGFSFMNGLGVTSGLFFVVLVSHIDLRKELSEDLIFLEVFYFLMYLVILAVSVAAYRVARGGKRDGEEPGAVPVEFLFWERLYWPALMLGSLLITLYFTSLA